MEFPQVTLVKSNSSAAMPPRAATARPCRTMGLMWQALAGMCRWNA